MKPFASRLLAWWREHGRHDLPWQEPRTAYRVWLAEVMLQQTQVTTVIPYFQRFLEQFPELSDLAAASEDDVLALWSGLGYYSRGRNLHRAAQICLERHKGKLPRDPKALAALPGIGESTANAIASQAYNKVLPILDGNVKRVMARHAGIAGWPGHSQVQKQLWQAARERLPKTRGANYTQAIMDLGATLCTPRSPQCNHCPVIADCVAHQQQTISQLPGRKPRKPLPQRHAVFLLIQDHQQHTLLVRRPSPGIWAGLWCLPKFADSDEAQQWLDQQGLKTADKDHWGKFQHAFTHYKLDAEVWRLQLGPFRSHRLKDSVTEPHHQWLSLEHALAKGLPQPIRRVLEQSGQPDLF